MVPSRLDASHPHAQAVTNFLETLIETRGVEYKQSAPFADLEPHIVKTSMAMANLRGGGYIIIGVARSSGGLQRIGVSGPDLATYDADTVLVTINKYASPAVTAMVGTVPHHGSDYLVIAVSEFERTPVVCRRNGAWFGNKQQVFAGDVYIRPAGFIETRRPNTASEMDEVIDLASEKRAVRMVTSRDALNAAAAAAGTPLGPPVTRRATERYDNELGQAGSL